VDNVCSLHIVNNCPLCKQGQVQGAALEPIDEVARTVAGQKPFGQAPTSLSEPAPKPKLADKKAMSIVEAADIYAQSVEELSVISANLQELEKQVILTKIELLKVSERRDEAQAKLRELVQPEVAVLASTSIKG
jgi:hypothetical protein